MWQERRCSEISLKTRQRMGRRFALVANGLTHGGATRFVRNIVSYLDSCADGAQIYLLSDGVFPKLDHVRQIQPLNCTGWPTPALVRDGSVDRIFYLKTFVPDEHLQLAVAKTIVVHDLLCCEDNLGEFDQEIVLHFRKSFPQSLAVADRIVAMSCFTRDDIFARYPNFDREVSVCGGGIDVAFAAEPKNSGNKVFHPVKPYFLYAGSLSPRKNMLRVLRAFKEIGHRVPHRFYICTGETWGDDQVKAYIRDELSDRVVMLGRVTDDVLAHLYRYADAFIYISLYEGFGFPILEAQASGCPVLTSNRTSCPETAGEGALVVNPECVQEISDAMLQLAGSSTLRARLSHAGFENMKRYSWEKAIQNLIGD
jgi:glycosyltransferase involved in cell wall biosynthesis